jgi:hypothetical protein
MSFRKFSFEIGDCFGLEGKALHITFMRARIFDDTL